MSDLYEIVAGCMMVIDDLLAEQSDYRLHTVRAALELVAGELDRIAEGEAGLFSILFKA